MPRNAAETRARILDAAVQEFAEHGLAGGRVQRISELSGANPSSIYNYYGSKEALFAAAVDDAIGELARAEPLDPHDLAGSIVRWSQWAISHPRAVRLGTWRRLEAPEIGPNDLDMYRKLATDLSSKAAADVSAIPAADVVVMALHLVLAYAAGSPDVQGVDPRPLDDADRLAQFHHSLHEAIRRIVNKPSSGQSEQH